MDDFLIYGKTVQEHDERLRKFLQRLRENGVTLNREKCKFRTDTVEFLGFQITPEGVKPMNEKVEAIINFPNPKKITELPKIIRKSRTSTLLSTKNDFYGQKNMK